MHSGTYRAAPAWDATTVRHRGSGLGLALAINFIIFLVLMGLGAAQFERQKPDEVLVVDMMSSRQAAAPPATRAEKVTEKLRPKVPPIKPPIQLPVVKPLDMIELTREEYVASDIRNLGHVNGAGQQAAADDSRPIGRAPNGDILYGAEWYREPTDAELDGYMPRNAPEGYGVIACKTAPGHRVEDCVELENFPAGSHLASAVRQAAWQFKVRAPRKNGQELMGAWVRIKIEYLRGEGR